MAPQPPHSLPHHRLLGHTLAVQLAVLVHRVPIRDAELRAQARKAAKSAVLNAAEGAARPSRADKARVLGIAAAEASEAAAAVELAAVLGDCAAADAAAVVALASRVRAVLAGVGR